MSTKCLPSVAIMRMPSIIGVSGRKAETFWSHSGIRNRGKNVPDRNIIGKTTMWLSGAACRSFFAKLPCKGILQRTQALIVSLLRRDREWLFVVNELGVDGLELALEN